MDRRHINTNSSRSPVVYLAQINIIALRGNIFMAKKISKNTANHQEILVGWKRHRLLFGDPCHVPGSKGKHGKHCISRAHLLATQAPTIRFQPGGHLSLHGRRRVPRCLQYSEFERVFRPEIYLHGTAGNVTPKCGEAYLMSGAPSSVATTWLKDPSVGIKQCEWLWHDERQGAHGVQCVSSTVTRAHNISLG